MEQQKNPSVPLQGLLLHISWKISMWLIANSVDIIVTLTRFMWNVMMELGAIYVSADVTVDTSWNQMGVHAQVGARHICLSL